MRKSVGSLTAEPKFVVRQFPMPLNGTALVTNRM